MVAKSPEEAKAQAEKKERKTKTQSTDLARDFGGVKPKYFVSFDTYGNTRILQEIVGNQPEQRFLVVANNGIDYDLANGDQIVKQVRTYFKNNKEGLRKILFDLGYMTEREYTTRSEQAITSSILKVANEYTIDLVDSYRIDGKVKFPTFTKWLGSIPASDRGDKPDLPVRDINLMDRDVVEAIVRGVYTQTTDMSPEDADAFIQQETDRYVKQIKEGTLTTVKKVGGEMVRKTTKPFSEAQVRAELPGRIKEEMPGITNYKTNFDFLAFMNSLGAEVIQ